MPLSDAGWYQQGGPLKIFPVKNGKDIKILTRVKSF